MLIIRAEINYMRFIFVNKNIIISYSTISCALTRAIKAHSQKINK